MEDDKKERKQYGDCLMCGKELRKLTKTEMAPRNTMLLLDLGAGGKFYQADNAAGVTEASITAFIEAFESKSLEAKKVGQ